MPTIGGGEVRCPVGARSSGWRSWRFGDVSSLPYVLGLMSRLFDNLYGAICISGDVCVMVRSVAWESES